MKIEQEQVVRKPAEGERAKRRYQSPALTVFGKVALLTQSASGCNQGDNPACSAPVSNMGPMAGSSRHIKEHIVRIGTHPLGIGLYLFDYKCQYRARWGSEKQFGVMADEVAKVLPEAVVMHPEGYEMVDYGMLARATRAIH
jgi:hypothetical protein